MARLYCFATRLNANDLGYDIISWQAQMARYRSFQAFNGQFKHTQINGMAAWDGPRGEYYLGTLVGSPQVLQLPTTVKGGEVD